MLISTGPSISKNSKKTTMLILLYVFILAIVLLDFSHFVSKGWLCKAQH